jgi:hypothetical protein
MIMLHYNNHFKVFMFRNKEWFKYDKTIKLIKTSKDLLLKVIQN